jgi:hypothetical protein
MFISGKNRLGFVCGAAPGKEKNLPAFRRKRTSVSRAGREGIPTLKNNILTRKMVYRKKNRIFRFLINVQVNP